MTNQQHPITPPPELVQQWDEECDSGYNPEIDNTFDALKCFASKAARWGADQELEACCEWLEERIGGIYHRELRAARRPKPPSLKAGAIEVLDELDGLFELPAGHYNAILRALEQLDD